MTGAPFNSAHDPRQRVMNAFREEIDARLDRMVETLVALERSAAPPDAIDSLFRDAHSIKGSAGMMGLDEPYSIGHAIEDVLAKARAEASFAPALVEPVLRATDALRRAAAGESGIAGPAVAAMAAAASGVVGTEAPRPTASAEPAAAAPGELPRQALETEERRSMRVDADKVDRLLDAVGETVLHHRRLQHTLRDSDAGPAQEHPEEVMDAGEGVLEHLQDAVLRLRMLPLASITGPFPRAVRDLAVGQGKEAELLINGAESQLDRVILDGTAEAIVHLLRNAVAHGLESPDERERAGKARRGRIELRAEQHGDHVAIQVADDGRGVAAELLRKAGAQESLAEVLAEAGMSTATAVTDVSGRGVGLDAVRSHVASVGGTLAIRSEPGRGTTVTMMLPVSLALLDVLLLERSGITFGVPIAGVTEVIKVSDELSLQGRRAVDVRGEAVPLADLLTVLGDACSPLHPGAPAVVVAVPGRRAALLCDRVLEEQEVLVKSLGPLLARTSGYLGGAVMGDGRIALILDPSAILAAVSEGRGRIAPPQSEIAATPTVLVVDDQFTVRELQRSILEAGGYRVHTASDGREAWELLSTDRRIDLVVTDLEMPGMDGLELLGAIRRHAQRSSLPVVVVTSRASDEDERRGLEAGADAYIVKARFDQRALLETVQRLIGR